VLALILDQQPRVGDVPEPERQPGEALVAVRVAGVCDTDLQLARGYMGFTGVPGHEVVGDVVTADDPAWIGKRVVADINAGCGECVDCRLQGGHHCSKRTVLGIVGRSGALAERFTIPERCLVEVPESLPDERAVFAEPLAAALHVLDEVDAASVGRAVVVGDGKLGQLIARALASAQIDTAIIGHHPSKLALARDAGIIGYLEDALPKALHGAGLVVEATGNERGFARALEIVRPRGTVVLKTTVATKYQVDLSPIVINEVRIIGSRCGSIARAVAALTKRSVDPTPLVEARYPLVRADEALEHAGRRGTLKVLVDVHSRDRSPGGVQSRPKAVA
jgi:threonine dehydrogenase-like Zn-dependent dehydrogenase